MKIEISKDSAQAVVDSVEYAISFMQAELTDADTLLSDTELASIRRSIEDLQMIRVSYMLIARNAAKEQRKGRASLDCTCCAGDESTWFGTDSCQLHTN